MLIPASPSHTKAFKWDASVGRTSELCAGLKGGALKNLESALTISFVSSTIILLPTSTMRANPDPVLSLEMVSSANDSVFAFEVRF